MTELCDAPLVELIAACQEQALSYLRTRRLGDDSACLELFRRAFQEGDQRAWAFIYTFYSTDEFLGDHYLLKWIRSWMHGRHGPTIRASLTEEEIVQEVWIRFLRSEAALRFSFPDMTHLMAYLRRLVNNLMMDLVRRRVPEIVEGRMVADGMGPDELLSALPDGRATVHEHLVNREAMEALLREIIGAIVTTREELLVFNGYFIEELPPRRLYALHPGVFADGQVETIRTRLGRRLRKAPYLLSRYIKIVLLQDNPRLRIVFEQSLVAGQPDAQVLASHPDLFIAPEDLLAAKVHVLDLLRSRPILLSFLDQKG